MPVWETYFSSLGLTLLVEVPIYAGALALMLRVRPRWGALAGTGVNIVSHPIGFLIIGPAVRSSVGFTGALVVIETMAVISEWGLLLCWRRRDPAILLAISILANGASFLAGVALLH